MTRSKIYSLLFLFLSLISCTDEPVDFSISSEDPGGISPQEFLQNFGSNMEARFMGKVVNESNEPISGVVVQVGNTTALTNDQGVFSIENASVQEKFAYLKATKAGYIDGSRSLTPKEGVNLVEIMLFNMEPEAVINSGEESTVNLSNGTEIVFTGDFVNQVGAAYSGPVHVILKHLNPSNENIVSQMPGMLVGQTTEGSLRVLETYGMLAVELRGSSDEELQLAEGSTAKITLPVVNNLSSAPQSMPLWSFDEAYGFWKQEGEATLVGNTYVGEVSHFSFWNWDYPYPSVYVCINLVDEDGNPLSYTPVNLFSPALNSIGTYGYTNNEGFECGLVPANDQMVLVIPDYNCSGNNFSTLIGPFDNDQNITVTVTSSDVVDSSFIGVFNNCDGEPVANGYLEIDLAFNGETYIFPITDGVMSLYVNYCGLNTGYTLQAVDLDTNQITAEISGNFTNPITDIGTLFTCDDAPNEIVAVGDGMDAIEVTSSLGATAVVNVLDNDTLNGVAVTANDVTITATNLPNGIFLNADGTVDVNENIATGQYEFEYTICENANTSNCDTATVFLYITNTSMVEIVAVGDGMDGIVVTSSSGATAVVNVLDNDTLNGVAVTANDVTITATNLPNGIFLNADGTVDVNENIATGQYEFEYTICENADPNNCSTTTVFLFITNSSTVEIVAVGDGMDAIEVTNSLGATAVLNVLDNDTLNGVAVTANDVTITATNLPNGIFLNADGTVDVNENMATGQYEFGYTICEIANPNNCSAATVSLFITNTSTVAINAVDDGMDGIAVTNSLGATNVVNVLDNDTFNGVTVNANEVSITSTTNYPDNIFLNADGSIDVNENTPTGTYDLMYTICEIANPNNCDSATVTLFVTNTSAVAIVAVDDIMDGIEVTNSLGATNVVNVLGNDTLNGVAVSTNEVAITDINTNFPNNIILNADGSIDVNENTPTGTYELMYTICEIINGNPNPNNCNSATVTLYVTNSSGSINAEYDWINAVGTPQGQVVLNVLNNDTLNGADATPNNVSITVGDGNQGDYILLDANGDISMPLEFTPSADYQFPYTICEIANPNNCNTSSVSIYVNNTITAVDDALDAIDGTATATSILNVLDNDTLNGGAMINYAVTTTTTTNDSGDYFVLNSNGSIDLVIANVPSGTYTINYQICENFTSVSNCSSASVTLIVN